MAAICHKPVDRVPIGFYAIDYDTVEKVLGHDITIIKDPVAERRSYTLKDFDQQSISEPDSSIFEVIDAVIDVFGGKKFIIGPSNGTSVMVLLGGNYEIGLKAYHTMPEVVRQAITQQVLTAEKTELR